MRGAGYATLYALEVASAERRMGRPAGRTKAQTRTRIIASALHCFSRHGYGGATNKMIADGAGLTTGALYRHFPTKHDLYLAVFTDVNNQIIGRLEVAVSGTGSLREAVLAVSQVARMMNAENPLMAPFLTTVRLDVGRYAELAHIQAIPRIPAVDRFEEQTMAAQSADRALLATPSCYTEALWAILAGVTHFAIHAESPERFAALMCKVEHAVEQAAAQIRRSSTAIAGLDYPVIGELNNAAGT